MRIGRARNQAEGGAKTAVKERRKKPDELLSSVVSETPVPPVLELLRANPRFAFPSGNAWVALLLEAEAIGGLSKRQHRDQDKGSIIELISSDQIHVIATADMLAEEVFAIVPDAESLSRMEEYSLLTEAPYKWAVIWTESGELVVQDVEPGPEQDGSPAMPMFEKAAAVLRGSLPLHEAVGAQVWEAHSGSAYPGDDPIEGEPYPQYAPARGAADDQDAPVFTDDPAFGDGDGYEDEAPVFTDDDAPIFTDETMAHPVDEPGIEDPDDLEGSGPVFTEDDHEAYDEDLAYAEADQDLEGLGDELVPTFEPVADADTARSLIARRFLDEELDLQVGLEEFNTTFAIGTPQIAIELPAGASAWLGDQIEALSRSANAELALRRQKHDDELRALYVNLMSTHIEAVLRDVSIEGDGGNYKEVTNYVKAQHEERLAGKDEAIRARRKEISAEYDKNAKMMAEQAARAAEAQYRERNRTKMEREQLEAVTEIERDLEGRYTHSMAELLKVRRRHAQVKVQNGQTRIFEVLATKRTELMEDEEELLRAWEARITKVIEDNRAADVAQAQTLATFDQMAALRADHESNIEAMRAEHARRQAELENELERASANAANQIAARDDEWNHVLGLEQRKVAEQAERIEELMNRLHSARQEAGAEHLATIAGLKADKESFAQELEMASVVQSRATKVMALLMIALALVCLGVGILLGVVWF